MLQPILHIPEFFFESVSCNLVLLRYISFFCTIKYLEAAIMAAAEASLCKFTPIFFPSWWFHFHLVFSKWFLMPDCQEFSFKAPDVLRA